MGMMDDMLEKAGVDEQSEELAELSQVGRQSLRGKMDQTSENISLQLQICTFTTHLHLI